MTRTVDEVGALIGEPPLNPMSPIQQLKADYESTYGEKVWTSAEQESRVVGSLAVRLLPGMEDLLAPVQAAEQRAQDIMREWMTIRATVRTTIDQVRTRLLDDPSAAPELIAANKAAESVEAAEQQFRHAARQARSRGYTAFAVQRDAIFSGAQAACYHVVEQVRAVLPLPANVWGAPDPERAMVDAGRIADWAVLVEADVRWRSLHELADLLRDAVGASPDMIQSAAPRLAMRYRNWEEASGDDRFRLLHKVLRLPYAIEHGWDPGIWRPSDIDQPGQKPASFGARMAARAGEVLTRKQKPAPGTTPRVTPEIPAATPAGGGLRELGIG